MSKTRIDRSGKPGWLPAALAVAALLLAAGCQPAAPARPAAPPLAATATTAPPPPAATATTAPPPPAATATTAPPPLAATATTAPPPPAATATTAPPPPAPTATTAPPPPPAGGDPARGQQVFAGSCNACHPGGQQGVGPSLVGVSGRLSDAVITQIVKQGRGGMPAVGAGLTDQQVTDLLAYLKTLR